MLLKVLNNGLLTMLRVVNDHVLFSLSLPTLVLEFCVVQLTVEALGLELFGPFANK